MLAHFLSEPPAISCVYSLRAVVRQGIIGVRRAAYSQPRDRVACQNGER